MSLLIIIISLFIPLLMIGTGLLVWLNPPKNMNQVYGYRTTRSMSCQEAWDYAQTTMGKLWTIIGIILVGLSYWLISILNYDTGSLLIIILSLQCLPLFISLAFVESRLKKNFS